MSILLWISLSTILLYLLYKATKPSKTLAPPGPPRLPLIGNLHQFLAAGNLPAYLWELSKKHGPIVHLELGSLPVVVVSSAELAKQVLKTQDQSFCTRPKFLGQQRLSYASMDMAFAPYGDYWRELRKIASVHLLSARKVQSFRPVREEEVSRMINKISSISSEREGVVNLSEMAIALGSSLICRIAFGRGCEDGYGEAKQLGFGEMLREAQGVLASLSMSDFFPWLGWVDWINGYGSWVERTYKNLDGFYQELINEHLDPKRKEKEKDVVDALIQLKEERSLSIDFDWRSVKAMLMNIFIGATDTSAATTVWVMTALIKAPKIMSKLQQEIRNLAGQKGRVDEDDLPQLPYLKAVINETFRLHPPIPLLMPREAMQRCTLHGYEIEPKTVVYVHAGAVARDPECWKDPDEFVPERFLNSDIDDVKGQDFGFLPFGAGRRMCPGSVMGIVNVELAVANLLYSFDWETLKGMKVEDIDEESHPGITMHKKRPLLLVAKRYSP
ncbi:6,7,8-trihydroxycoumarin synthase-like [Salvia miltiorrhiza]|uniref:6,7,8-trihydroxycoumarin synthase-like n=1 Tax=Salvia miltiorrhiza TaxID=226208 RepID=UPI0025AC5FCD|nr:6,7,8-trihydroxycoumarin synthase-like [Salvia miltiorrhiza]